MGPWIDGGVDDGCGCEWIKFQVLRSVGRGYADNLFIKMVIRNTPSLLKEPLKSIVQ